VLTAYFLRRGQLVTHLERGGDDPKSLDGLGRRYLQVGFVDRLLDGFPEFGVVAQVGEIRVGRLAVVSFSFRQELRI